MTMMTGRGHLVSVSLGQMVTKINIEIRIEQKPF